MGKSVNEEIDDAVNELKFGHPETRKKAAIKLGRIRDKRVIPFLIEAAKNDDYPWTRVSAIQSLSWIGDPKIIDPLIDIVLNDGNRIVRKTAIEILGNMKDEKAIEPLNKIVNSNDESDEIKKAASVAIQVIQGITPSWSQDN